MLDPVLFVYACFFSRVSTLNFDSSILWVRPRNNDARVTSFSKTNIFTESVVCRINDDQETWKRILLKIVLHHKRITICSVFQSSCPNCLSSIEVSTDFKQWMEEITCISRAEEKFKFICWLLHLFHVSLIQLEYREDCHRPVEGLLCVLQGL